MYRKTMAIFFICLFLIVALSAQSSGESKKTTPAQKENKKSQDIKSQVGQGVVDEMQQQYLNMQHSLNSDIEKEYKNITSYRALTRINHEYIMTFTPVRLTVK